MPKLFRAATSEPTKRKLQTVQRLVLDMAAGMEKLEQQQAELLAVKQQLSEKVNGT